MIEKSRQDKVIFCGVRKVLNMVKDNSQLLYTSEDNPTYIKTQEIMRYTNEIGRYINERMPNFNTGKKLIMECASLKFAACRYNSKNTVAEYIAEQLTQEQEYLQKGFLRKIIERIIVKADGNIVVRFIGGVEVSENDIGDNYGSAS